MIQGPAGAPHLDSRLESIVSEVKRTRRNSILVVRDIEDDYLGTGGKIEQDLGTALASQLLSDGYRKVTIWDGEALKEIDVAPLQQDDGQDRSQATPGLDGPLSSVRPDVIDDIFSGMPEETKLPFNNALRIGGVDYLMRVTHPKDAHAIVALEELSAKGPIIIRNLNDIMKSVASDPDVSRAISVFLNRDARRKLIIIENGVPAKESMFYPASLARSFEQNEYLLVGAPMRKDYTALVERLVRSGQVSREESIKMPMLLMIDKDSSLRKWDEIASMHGRLDERLIAEHSENISFPYMTARDKLMRLVGLEQMKYQYFPEIDALARSGKRHTLNASFEGNVGTGKTEVARILAQHLVETGYLDSGVVEYFNAIEFSGEFVGQAPERMGRALKKTKGGVLILDEIYVLREGSMRDHYGLDAINALLVALENERLERVVYFLGYKERMDDFFAANPGILSRTPGRYYFPDPSLSQLQDIFRSIIERNGYRIDGSLDEQIPRMITSIYDARDPENFGNGRDMRNLFEEMERSLLMLGGEAFTSDIIPQRYRQMDYRQILAQAKPSTRSILDSRKDDEMRLALAERERCLRVNQALYEIAQDEELSEFLEAVRGEVILYQHGRERLILSSNGRISYEFPSGEISSARRTYELRPVGKVEENLSQYVIDEKALVRTDSFKDDWAAPYNVTYETALAAEYSHSGLKGMNEGSIRSNLASMVSELAKRLSGI